MTYLLSMTKATNLLLPMLHDISVFSVSNWQPMALVWCIRMDFGQWKSSWLLKIWNANLRSCNSLYECKQRSIYFKLAYGKQTLFGNMGNTPYYCPSIQTQVMVYYHSNSTEAILYSRDNTCLSQRWIGLCLVNIHKVILHRYISEYWLDQTDVRVSKFFKYGGGTANIIIYIASNATIDPYYTETRMSYNALYW